MSNSTLSPQFLSQATLFLEELVDWQEGLSSLTWQDINAQARPEQIALFSVDMINGFCHMGALASPRVKGIIPAVVDVFTGAYEAGVRNFVLAQDSHSVDAAEFADFPPHCIAGTSEAENIPELASLPFAHLFHTVPKNSLSAFHNTNLSEWLSAHPDLRVALIVGDCTDLCVQQMALHLKLLANATDNTRLRVIVPENAVQTYDIPVATAQELGSLPHDGDVMHLIALYHLRLNGVEVVREIKRV